LLKEKGERFFKVGQVLKDDEIRQVVDNSVLAFQH